MKIRLLSLLLVSTGLLFNSCVKNANDIPLDTSRFDPALPTQMSMKDISMMGQNLGSGRSRIMGDTTIYGVVVADDRSGNYYKQIVIQDKTNGGIVLYLDRSYLYNDYPVGRGVYVKLKGLTLTNYRGLPEIVYSADAAGNTTPIPSGLIANYIVKGKYPDTSVKAQEITILEALQNATNYLSTLVKIKDVQFDNASYNQPYSLPSSQTSGTDRGLTNCDGTINLTMRNSAYSNFQSYLTPSGKGDVYCVVSTYAGKTQVVIRDTTDVVMTNPRCL